MAKQTVFGVLLEAEKIYHSNNGAVTFTREALQNAADDFNASQQGDDKIVFAMRGNKLVCALKDVEVTEVNDNLGVSNKFN